MKKSFALFAAASAVALTAASPAMAQNAGDVTFRVGVSHTKIADKGTIYIDGVDAVGAGYKSREAYHGTFSATYFPIKWVGIDASISTPITTNNVPAGTLAGIANLGDDKFIIATVGARFQPLTGLVSPYVGGGFAEHVTVQERDGYASNLNVKSTNGPYVEGGIELNLGRTYGVFADVRKAWYHTTASGQLPIDPTDPTDVRAHAIINPITITVGLTAHLPSSKDGSAEAIGTDTTHWTIRGGLTSLTLRDKMSLMVGGAPYPGAGMSTYEHHTPTVQVGYFLTSHIAINATIGLPPTVKVFGAGSIGSLPKLGDVKYGPTTLTLQYHPLRSGLIRPYVGAGASYMIVFDTTDGAFQNLKVNNYLGYVFEAGSDFMVANHWGLFADAKKAMLRPKAFGTFDGLPVEGHTKLDPWAFTGGVSFHFW